MKNFATSPNESGSATAKFSPASAKQFIPTKRKAWRLGGSFRIQSKNGGVVALQLPFPPFTGGCFFRARRKVILVNPRAQVTWRVLGEWIRLHQGKHLRRSLQEFSAKRNEPIVAAIGFQRREPHLPIQPRLVRLHKSRREF